MFPILLSAPVAEDILRRHALVIRAAIERAYGTIQAGCIDMETSPANFAKELSGERTLRLTPLMKLNREFWTWYPVLLTKEFGIPQEVRQAALVMFGLGIKPTMAKVSDEKVRTA